MTDLIRRMRGRGSRPTQRAIMPGWQWLNLAESGVTWGGTLERALTHTAVWAALDVISDAVSRTPVDVVRYQNDRRIPVAPPPLIGDPNPTLVTDDVWRAQLAFSLATQGNGFGIVLATDTGGRPTAVQLVDPYAVSAEVRDGLKWIGYAGTYGRVWQDGGRYWHCPGRHMRAGSPFGMGPCEYSGETIGLGLAAREFSNRFFSDGGHPVWGFGTDQELSLEQATELKASIAKALKPGSREPLIYGKGLNPTQFSVNPSDASFIDLMRYVNEEAARVWRIPPSSIAASISGQSVTYANIGDQDLRTLKDCIDGYFVRIEKALTACLPRPQVVKFNRNAVLRADPKSRNDVYDVRLRNRTMTINEVRRLEDEQPFPDPIYDDPGIPDQTIFDPAGDQQKGSPRDIAEVVQKIYLGVTNGVITAEEARTIINRLGADLPDTVPVAPPFATPGATP